MLQIARILLGELLIWRIIILIPSLMINMHLVLDLSVVVAIIHLILCDTLTLRRILLGIRSTTVCGIVICHVLRFRWVSLLLLGLCLLRLVRIIFGFSDIYNINIVAIIMISVSRVCIEISNILGLIILWCIWNILIIIAVTLYYLYFLLILLSFGRVTSGKLLGLFLITHHRGNLFLGTLKEFINLTLPLVLNRVVSSLDSRLVHWYLSSSWIFVTSSNLNSRLRARWSWAWSSYLPSILFMGLLHIFASDIFVFNVLIVPVSSATFGPFINNDAKLIKLYVIGAARNINFVCSSLTIVVTLSSLFDLIWVNQFSRLWIPIRRVFFRDLETILRLLRFLSWLLLVMVWVVALVVAIGLAASVCVWYLILISVVRLEAGASWWFLWVLLRVTHMLQVASLLMKLLNLILILIEVHILYFQQIGLILVLLDVTSTILLLVLLGLLSGADIDIRIGRLLSSVMECIGNLLRLPLVWIWLLCKALLSLLSKFILVISYWLVTLSFSSIFARFASWLVFRRIFWIVRLAWVLKLPLLRSVRLLHVLRLRLVAWVLAVISIRIDLITVIIAVSVVIPLHRAIPTALSYTIIRHLVIFDDFIMIDALELLLNDTMGLYCVLIVWMSTRDRSLRCWFLFTLVLNGFSDFLRLQYDFWLFILTFTDSSY